jgi:carboxypeptidase T
MKKIFHGKKRLEMSNLIYFISCKMKSKLLLILLLSSLNTVFAQTGPYVKVKFSANLAQLHSILGAGIDAEGLCKQNGYYTAELSQEELAILRSKAIKTEILISDVGKYYTERAEKDVANSSNNKLIVPPGFKLGSINGFLSYAEMVLMLDSMHKRYPHLITAKKSIGNTLENNPMYVVKISDNPNRNEANEKQVLYDAMHHAREPQAMMQLMYYMWYIMDRYEQNDPLAQYIINNRELYFVPIVNPDGYLYNQSIAPNGGGMWRKNRSFNNDGSRGVDLNRNYAYDWGYDDIGSSPLGNSNTFRGPTAFSEPETQNMRDFVNSKKIKSNLSYHTYGGYVIYPFGAKENYYTPDSTMFRLYADSLTKDNNYFAGTVFETLSYFANGGSCDWMYGDTAHAKIYSFTPEVGSAEDGFWPLPSRIIPLCEENIAPNLFLAKYALNGLDVLFEDSILSTTNKASVDLKYFSAGLENNIVVVSYLDFYNNPLLISNPDTLKTSGIGTFESINKKFNIEFNTSNVNTIVPYRIVTNIAGINVYDSAILIINKSTGFSNKSKTLQSISIYPNPSSTRINIDYKMNPSTSISIYTIDGKLISTHQQNSIDISVLSNGLYFISIKEGTKIIGIESFQKE